MGKIKMQKSIQTKRNDSKESDMSQETIAKATTRPFRRMFSGVEEMLESSWNKMVLYQLKNILLMEKNKGYYRNEMNIKEVIPIHREKIMDESGREVVLVQKMVLYYNGYQDYFTVVDSIPKVKNRTLH